MRPPAGRRSEMEPSPIRQARKSPGLHRSIITMAIAGSVQTSHGVGIRWPAPRGPRTGATTAVMEPAAARYAAAIPARSDQRRALLVAIDLFALFVAFLRLDRQRRDGPGFQPLQRDRLAGLL